MIISATGTICGVKARGAIAIIESNTVLLEKGERRVHKYVIATAT